MIKNNFESAIPILNLFHVLDEKIELAYPGEKIISNEGFLPLEKVENQIALIDKFSCCVTDTGDRHYIDLTINLSVTVLLPLKN
ncbi:MAG: hypothetical protein AB2L20_18795 [Mangrovibacterium sp.]